MPPRLQLHTTPLSLYMDGRTGFVVDSHISKYSSSHTNIDTRPLLQHDEVGGDEYFTQGDVTDSSSITPMWMDDGTSRSNKRPKDTAVKQQRMRSWQPILDPWYVIVGYLVFGVVFLSMGVMMRKDSNAVVELKVQYDGERTESADTDVYSYMNCTIQAANEGRVCELSIVVPEEMKAPVLVHYEMGDFYQNHRLYVVSRDDDQLRGSRDQTSLAKENCDPLQEVGNQTLNPCGLVANTLFNDIFEVSNSTDTDGEPLDLKLIEKGIAWKSDVDHRFKQPEGFYSEQCSSCDDSGCSCDGDRWSCNRPYEDDEVC